MKIKELIEALKKYDENLFVGYLDDYEDMGFVNEVYIEGIQKVDFNVLHYTNEEHFKSMPCLVLRGIL
jgi:hypothetical protein